MEASALLNEWVLLKEVRTVTTMVQGSFEAFFRCVFTTVQYRIRTFQKKKYVSEISELFVLFCSFGLVLEVRLPMKSNILTAILHHFIGLSRYFKLP
jgi:hypothetical protein